MLKRPSSAVDADDLIICHTATNLQPSRSPLNKGFFSDWWQYGRYFLKKYFFNTIDSYQATINDRGIKKGDASTKSGNPTVQLGVF